MKTIEKPSGNPLFQKLTLATREQGFVLFGGVDLARAETDFLAHAERYRDWLDSGFAGEMGYLTRGKDRRMDPRLVFENTQSVFCVALPYPAVPVGELDPLKGARYSRYMRILPDYHKTIAQKLEQAMRTVNDPSLEWKICVDTSAVLERSWAQLSGLGWIGKNTLLIHPQWGSYFLLGVVLLNQKLELGPSPLPNYCGNCNRCLQGCPTSAFETAGTLNSTECISYWTLEKRGELNLSQTQVSQLGNWVGGCDICQEVCPFNQKRAHAESLSDLDGDSFLTDWEALLAESPQSFLDRTRNTAMDRMKPAHFDRNLFYSLKSVGKVPSAQQCAQRAAWFPDNSPLWLAAW